MTDPIITIPLSPYITWQGYASEAPKLPQRGWPEPLLYGRKASSQELDRYCLNIINPGEGA